MNDQQEKLYQAMLDLNEQAKAAGEPHIGDPVRARTLLEKLATMANDKSAADLCARISDGRFDNELAAERRNLEEARKDFADGESQDNLGTIWRMEYLYMCIYYDCCNDAPGSKARSAAWKTIQVANSALSTGILQISQQKVINHFAKFIRGPRQRVYGEGAQLAEEMTISAGNSKRYSMRVENADKHQLRVSTQMLLHFLLKEFAQTHRTSVDISLRDYATLRGMGDSKNTLDELQNQVREDLYTLGDLKAEWMEKSTVLTKSGNRRSVYKPTGYIRLNGGTVDASRYIIHWNWNQDIVPSLQTIAPVDFPEEYFKLSPKDNSYPFAHYIALNYRRNEDKGPERYSKIRIATLLDAARVGKSYEELKKDPSRPNMKTHLIKPFFRDLNRVPRLIYEVFLADGTRVEDPEKLTTEEFMAAYIVVDYSAYPVHKHRIEQKKRHDDTKNKIAEMAKAANAVKTARKGKKADAKKD